MSFQQLKVTVTFDMVVHESRLELANSNIAYDMAHKIRVALSDSKDYMISTPNVQVVWMKNEN